MQMKSRVLLLLPLLFLVCVLASNDNKNSSSDSISDSISADKKIEEPSFITLELGKYDIAVASHSKENSGKNHVPDLSKGYFTISKPLPAAAIGATSLIGSIFLAAKNWKVLAGAALMASAASFLSASAKHHQISIESSPTVKWRFVQSSLKVREENAKRLAIHGVAVPMEAVRLQAMYPLSISKTYELFGSAKSLWLDPATNVGGVHIAAAPTPDTISTHYYHSNVYLRIYISTPGLFVRNFDQDFKHPEYYLGISKNGYVQIDTKPSQQWTLVRR